MSADPFDSDWTLGADGLWFRRGARVLLLSGSPGDGADGADGADDVRLLLVRGHDVDQPERSWWFTVGGGIGAGEEPAAAAVRELAEETGLVLAEGDLVGPVVERTAVFDFYARTCRQDELIYLAWLPRDGDAHPELTTAGWTAVEQESVDELRWWRLDDLAAAEASGVEVYPQGLAALVTGLLPGWDGVVRRLGRAGG